MDFFLKKYFHLNLNYKDIKDVMLKHNEINISLTSIKSKQSLLGLCRKYIEEFSIKEIVTAIIDELYSCGYNIGYRALWSK